MPPEDAVQNHDREPDRPMPYDPALEHPDRFREQVLERQFAFFCAAGFVAFLVDAATLWLILHFTTIDLLAGRALSFLGGVGTFWMLGRHLNFPAARRHQRMQERMWALVLRRVGAFANLGLYALLVLTTGFFAQHPVVAVVISSLVSLVITIWTRRKTMFQAWGQAAESD